MIRPRKKMSPKAGLRNGALYAQTDSGRREFMCPELAEGMQVNRGRGGD